MVVVVSQPGGVVVVEPPGFVVVEPSGFVVVVAPSGFDVVVSPHGGPKSKSTLTVASAWATPRVRQLAGPAMVVWMMPDTSKVTVPVPENRASTVGLVMTSTCWRLSARLNGVGTFGASVWLAAAPARRCRMTDAGPTLSSVAVNDSVEALDTDERFSTVDCTDPASVAVTVMLVSGPSDGSNWSRTIGAELGSELSSIEPLRVWISARADGDAANVTAVAAATTAVIARIGLCPSRLIPASALSRRRTESPEGARNSSTSDCCDVILFPIARRTGLLLEGDDPGQQR